MFSAEEHAYNAISHRHDASSDNSSVENKQSTTASLLCRSSSCEGTKKDRRLAPIKKKRQRMKASASMMLSRKLNKGDLLSRSKRSFRSFQDPSFVVDGARGDEEVGAQQRNATFSFQTLQQQRRRQQHSSSSISSRFLTAAASIAENNDENHLGADRERSHQRHRSTSSSLGMRVSSSMAKLLLCKQEVDRHHHHNDRPDEEEFLLSAPQRVFVPCEKDNNDDGDEYPTHFKKPEATTTIEEEEVMECAGGGGRYSTTVPQPSPFALRTEGTQMRDVLSVPSRRLGHGGMVRSMKFSSFHQVACLDDEEGSAITASAVDLLGGNAGNHHHYS
mmetsp:Transcript_3481/g.9986  ORF Transcript_3481/g.9986 Transcript_3481/m.9986 type:complete len:333 (+) Transcript_3481:251-1249(+)|eukprot:CAMPEP_0119568910 /NCGR_PEP_ID=MMETSP1352-20130426/40163_1 /TAXON_ID=265584 /ORGANISM="Stauroneis constricta, Strain CCMP1120" /LENGTH=332 /DNA_ID=CAMNT_0007618377 /DNA_START=233 /DNA_END=1231 /DNA_ORIENTATION=-